MQFPIRLCMNIHSIACVLGNGQPLLAEHAWGLRKPDCIDPDVHENMTAYAQIERRSAPPLPLRKPTPLVHAVSHLCLVSALQSSALLLHALLPPLAGGLGLRALGVHLLLEDPLAGLLGLGLVDL